MPAETNGATLGQDMFFLGYEYKMWTNAGPAFGGRPCPFVKKGALSSSFDVGDGIERFYIDALGNEGFSGGPIVFQERAGGDFKVCGIVSSYRTEREQVF